MYTTNTTLTGKPKVSLAEQQVRAHAKATTERAGYSFKLGNITIREKGNDQARKIGTVEVRNLTSGACYTVAFITAGVPHCNCPIALKNVGTAYKCKHALMAEEFVGMGESFESEPAGEEPKPASPEVRATIGNPEQDTKIVEEQDGLFYVHRIYGDGRYGFERALYHHNTGCLTRQEAEQVLNQIRKAREEAGKRPLSAFD